MMLKDSLIAMAITSSPVLVGVLISIAGESWIVALLLNAIGYTILGLSLFVLAAICIVASFKAGRAVARWVLIPLLCWLSPFDQEMIDHY